MFADFMSQYGLEIISLILTTILGILGTAAKNIYKRYVDDKTKAAVARIAARGVEQMYKELHGEEKLDKALKTEINSDSYIKLAKNYYGEDFNKYLESYETASIEELKASMGSEYFYQTLKEYISGICPAFSYDMNK